MHRRCSHILFNRFVNFYRRFVHEYSRIASLLIDLLQESKNEVKTKSFLWFDDAAKAFDKLREIFITISILIHFNLKLRIRMKIDASNFAIANILSQLQKNEQWHLIAFWFKKMISIERNYEIYDQELLAIVMTFKQWRHYVEESVYLVKVLTDHNNLREFMNVKKLNLRQIRWAMKLTFFDFIIVHRSRKTNSANASSRRSDYEEFKTIMKILLFTLQNKLFMLRTLIAKDMLLLEKICSKVAFALRLKRYQSRIETLESNNDETSAYIRRDLEKFSKMIVEIVDCKQLVSRVIIVNLIARETIYDSLNNFVQEIIKTLQREDSLVERHKNFKTQRRRKSQVEIQNSWSFDDKDILRYREAVYVLLKSSIREELLKRHHDDALARHFDTEKTQELLSRKFYWSNMINDVKEYVSTYDIC